MRRSLLALLPALMTVSSVGSGAEPPMSAPSPEPSSLTSFSGATPQVSSAGLVRTVQDAAFDPSATLAVLQQAQTDANPLSIVAPSVSDPSRQSPFANTKPIELSPLQTPNTSTSGIGTGIHPTDVTEGRLPEKEWLPTGKTRHGDWSLQAKAWVPGGFCHQPLYFEDPMLERHGHERFPHLQPFVSGARFFGTFPVFPYLLTLRHPLDEVHTLGAYRPGTSAPMLRYRPHYEGLFE